MSSSFEGRVRRTRARAQSGQALIEAALALTLMLFIIVGLYEFAPLIVRGAQLTQAVRDGASYARSRPSDTEGIRDRVVRSFPAPAGTAIDRNEILVLCLPGLDKPTPIVPSPSCDGARSVEVTATIRYPLGTSVFNIEPWNITETIITRSATSEIY